MKDKIKNQKNFNPIELKEYRLGIRFFKVILALCFSVLVYQLYNLQIVNGSSYKQRAINNKKQVIKIPSYRGEIFTGDKEEKIVENQPAYSLYLVPNPFYNLRKKRVLFKEMLFKIEEKFAIPQERVLDILKRKRINPFTPVLIKKNVEEKTIFFLVENKEKFPGLIFINTLKRNYLKGKDFAHITGYLQKISSKGYIKKKNQGYFVDSFVGKQGIEAYYDRELRGEVGFKIQTIDVKNRVRKEVSQVNNSPIPGHHIYLTIDPHIQETLAKVMRHYVGGVMVTRVSTGEILGLYSSPSYDPNLFSGNIDEKKFKTLIDDQDNPFFNRVIQGQYPPSSIFKLVVALMALDNPLINFNTTRYHCSGGIKIGGKFFKCTSYHGNQNFISAIANSCNVFFYKLGILIGPSAIHRGAKTFFNLGQLQLVDLPFERVGRIPSQKWKLERLGNFWWDGDTANFSIGQGFSLVTVLQINTVTAAIANGGIAYQPHLVKKLYDLENNVEIKKDYQEVINLPFSQINIKRVQNAMHQVVKWGTARIIDNKRYSIAGKTGTAEVYKKKIPHSWFTGYTSYKGKNKKLKDQLAITVLVEYGGFGGVLATTFSRAILDNIFLNKDPYLTIKEILQPWSTQSDIYLEWLNKHQQKKLPADYFQSNL